jgi:hypothetical protein
MAPEKRLVRFVLFLGVLLIVCPIGLGRADNLVSLIQLIASPEKYDGKRVGVIGFLRLEFEGDKLYLHEDDYRFDINENGIWLGITKKQRQDLEDRNMHYAFVVGTFKAGNGQITGHANGTIVNITVVEVWPRKGPSN